MQAKRKKVLQVYQHPEQLGQAELDNLTDQGYRLCKIMSEMCMRAQCVCISTTVPCQHAGRTISSQLAISLFLSDSVHRATPARLLRQLQAFVIVSRLSEFTE